MRPFVAFDLDGTLVDSLEDIRRATERAFPEFGSVDATTAAQIVGGGARALVRRYFALQGIDAAHHAPADLDATLARGLVRFKEAYRPHLIDHSRPFPGIVGLVNALIAHDVAVAVATNKPGDWGREMVDALMPDLFAEVIGPEDGAHKPSPAMLAELVRRVGRPMTIYVGDSVVDLDAAIAQGAHPILVTYGLTPGDRLREAAQDTSATVVDTVDALSQVIFDRISTSR